MAGRYRRNGEAETLGCLVQVLLLIFAMPLVGLYLLAAPNSGKKGLGVLLTVFGFALLAHFSRNITILEGNISI